MRTVSQVKVKEKIWPAVRILLYALAFFFALDLMGEALKLLAAERAMSFIHAANNPFIGLFIGLLTTAIIQSSSTTTSIAVALVASGAIQFNTAVPIIMGANIGTSITATIVSLAFIGKKKKFRRGLSVALSHHFFNVILVLLLFPLEYYYGALSEAAQTITQLFAGNLVDKNAPYGSSSPGFSLADHLLGFTNGYIGLVISLVLLIYSIKSLAKYIYDLLVFNRNSDYILFLKNPYRSFTVGFLLTTGVQSSSVTTSFAVPLAATGQISVKRIFPFIIGANVGTTITAFFATLFKSEVALIIAFAHLIFNLIGVLLFLPFSSLRELPVKAALYFSDLTIRRRFVGFLYLLIIFFILPFALISLN